MFRITQKFKIKAKYTKNALKREIQDSYKKLRTVSRSVLVWVSGIEESWQ